MEKYTPADVLRFAQRIFEWSFWKWGLAAGVATLANFIHAAPGLWRDLLVALLVLNLLDLISGVWVSIVVKKRHLSSAGMQQAISKLLLYGIVFVTSNLVDSLFKLPYTFSFLVLSLCVLREGTSVGENTRSLWEVYFPSTPWPFGSLFDKFKDLASEKPKPKPEPRTTTPDEP